jgi:hypothetical protein
VPPALQVHIPPMLSPATEYPWPNPWPANRNSTPTWSPSWPFGAGCRKAAASCSGRRQTSGRHARSGVRRGWWHNALDPPFPPLAAGVLVIAGDEHRRAHEQIAPFVKLGHHRVAFGFGFALAVAQLPVQAGLSGVGLVDPREGLGSDAVAKVLLHHPAADANRAVVITAAVAPGFPSH